MRHNVTLNGITASVCETFFERTRGLIGRPPPAPGHGLLIPKCNAIHTCFMGYPIDATFLDADNRVVRIVRNIPPWRPFVWGGFKSRSVLETSVEKSARPISNQTLPQSQIKQ